MAEKPTKTLILNSGLMDFAKLDFEKKGLVK